MFMSTVADVNNETASDAAAAARLAQRERAEELAVVQDWRALQHKGYDYSFDAYVLLTILGAILTAPLRRTVFVPRNPADAFLSQHSVIQQCRLLRLSG
jgi:uncharacterized protein YfaS (alpha-2-macroglobulin family)